MLKIEVTTPEVYDEEAQEFLFGDDYEIEIEHSLLSVSKWESKYERPFLDDKPKSNEEVIDYVRMMTLTPGVPDEVYSSLTQNNIEDISDYIASKQTATWFREDPNAPKKKPQEQITAELIYFWMISYRIPMETQHWHLNRLLTLVRVFNVKNEKPKKMSRSQIAEQNRVLNAQRRKQMNTKG